jgi:outer membrane lipoprotein-sorting protein
MHKFYFLLTISIFSSTLSGQEVAMSVSEIASFKEQVAVSTKTTTTIVSDFVQYKHMDFLANDIETSGMLAFKAPGLVKWEYTEPYQYSVIFKEDKLLINDGGTKSDVDIGSSRLFKKLNELIVDSVKGNMFEEDDFTISYYKTSKGNKAIFKPRDKKIAGYISSFELLFNKEDGAVQEVKMIEPSADFTQIVFSNRVLNSTVNDSVFNN